MEVSRVTFTRETKAMLTNPILNRTKRSRLRIQRLKEYVDSFPNGHEFRMKELIEACGYDHMQNATGWQFINTAAKNKKFKLMPTNVRGKYNVFFGVEPSRVNQVPKPDVLKIPKPTPGSTFTINKSYDDVISEVVEKARKFAWDHNSDSLREFIATLQ